MVELSDIKWGSYTSNSGQTTFEGPYYHGKWKYTLPEDASVDHKIIYAITATEGGTYDAVNMYDVCIMTVGIVQWCDKFNLTSRMLGYVAEHGGIDLVTKHVRDMQIAEKLGARIEFKRNRNKVWRWHLGGNECGNPEKLRELYLGGSSGKKGEWSERQKDIARRWAVAMARIWDNPRARELQVEFTATRTNMFALPDGRKILLDAHESWDGWIGATKAFYLAYAANNPRKANEKVVEADKTLTYIEKWSEEWCIKLIRILALESGMHIWPGRYDRSRAAYEKLYGIELPKDSEALRLWVPASEPIPEPDPTSDPDVPEPPIPEPEHDSIPVIVTPVEVENPELEINPEVPLPPHRPAPIIEYRDGWSFFKFIGWLIKLIVSVWRNKG